MLGKGDHTKNAIKDNKRSRAFSSAKQIFFQPKLKIGPTDDVYEKEADAIAEKVMRKPSESEQPFFSAQALVTSVQKKCETCEEEEKLQRKEKGNANIEAPTIVSDALNSGGNDMDHNTKSFMENRFGHDFSNVKIHTDAVAAKSAQSIDALAYTSGSSIVFNEGQYNPSTESGKKLLAHELTHVVQQRHSSANVQRQPKPQPQPQPQAPVCPTFPTSGVQVIGPYAKELAIILSSCAGFEVTLDTSQKLKMSNKAVKGAKKNTAAKDSVSRVVNNKVGIIVDTDPKALGTTVGTFSFDCPGRQFINVKNVLVLAKATGASGGIDSCSVVLHEMEEAVQARTLAAKVQGKELFKQSHEQGTKIEDAIRKDDKLPIRDQTGGQVVKLGELAADQWLYLKSEVYGADKNIKTHLIVFVCTPTQKNPGEKKVCIIEVKASHVVDGAVKFSTAEEALRVYNKHAKDFGMAPLGERK